MEYEKIFEDSLENKDSHNNVQFADWRIFKPTDSSFPCLLRFTTGYRGCDDDCTEWKILGNFSYAKPAQYIRQVIKIMDNYNFTRIEVK